MKAPSYKLTACIVLLSVGICLGTRQWSAAFSALFSAYLLYRLDKAEAKKSN